MEREAEKEKTLLFSLSGFGSGFFTSSEQRADPRRNRSEQSKENRSLPLPTPKTEEEPFFSRRLFMALLTGYSPLKTKESLPSEALRRSALIPHFPRPFKPGEGSYFSAIRKAMRRCI